MSLKPIKKSLLLSGLLTLGFPLFVAMLVFGGCGMAYLLDYEATGPFKKHRKFSAVMETLMKLNIAFIPLIFNVGLVGIIGVIVYFKSPKEEVLAAKEKGEGSKKER
jgi:hypothetical protein